MPKATKKPATKTVAKKATAKKVVKKTVKPVVAAKPVAFEIPEPDRYCHCTKRKRNVILTCTFTVAFLFGMLTYHVFFCPDHPHFKPHTQFVNGCMDVASVKCPKLLQDLPTIDADHDGCVTKAELRAAKKAMRHHKKDAPVEQPAVVDAIAPVME